LPRTPPVLVRQVRGGVVESRHRGSIVEVTADGSVRRVLGDPDTVVNLRSAVKPFGLVALVEAGGVEELDLS
jgi:L-asparaginase II